MMNKLVKSRNGNRNDRTNLNIIHWNGGARKWENKLEEIESLVRERNPDLCYISEANLWSGLDPLNMNIPGYNLHFPNTMDSLQHSRLVLLSKDDLIVKEIVDKTEKELAMIWVQIGASKKNSLLIGGMYRQHKLLGLDRMMTGMELIQEQEKRWSRFVKKWKNLARNKNCLLIGDLNLDHLRWSHPETYLEKMVEEVKDHIETSGFLQIVQGYTRTWRSQADSCLDHVWTNCPDRTVNTINEKRSSSDHNVIGVTVSGKQLRIKENNIVKRVWKILKKQTVWQSSDVGTGQTF